MSVQTPTTTTSPTCPTFDQPSRQPRSPDPAKRISGKDRDALHDAITTSVVAEEKQASSPKLAVAAPTPPPPALMSNLKAPGRPSDRIPIMAHRTASIDSTVSSASSINSHRNVTSGTSGFRVSQEHQGPQDVAALIASAGSAEAALQKVWAEKQQAASHNAQLWRLVEKQRAMILGLNKDLEKSLKEKERYRRKLKDHLSQSTSAPALMNVNGASSASMDAHSRETSQSPSQLAPARVLARDLSVDTLKTSDTSGSAPNSSVGRSDTPQDIASPQSALEDTSVASISPRDPHDRPRAAYGTIPVPVDTSVASRAVQRGAYGTPPLSPRMAELAQSSKKDQGHQKSSSQTSLPATSVPLSAQGFSSPKQRKAPPAPLKLESPRAQPSMVNNIVDASDSEYEDDPASARSEHNERGRRKTREDDDREREVMFKKEEEQRSRSKKDKKSKSRPAEQTAPATQTIPQAESPVSEAARLQGPFFQPTPADIVRTRAASDAAPVIQRPQVAAAPAGLLSPGLPISPRPGDRPPNSPMPRGVNGQAANSIPMSPRAVPGMTLSPRQPRAPIPLPPQTPMSLMSPHLDRAKTYAQQAPQQAPQPPQAMYAGAAHLKPANAESPDHERPSLSSDQSSVYTPAEVYKGFQTEQYPDLLLPPNALPSIYVKTASSRMIRSRASMIAPRNADENPVFTLSVYARSDNTELWRVEKTFASLAVLDQDVKSICRLRERIPDKALFTGHAPAKIDARRMALNAYFERMLDSVTEEKAARFVCKFLSTDAFNGESGDYFGTASDGRRPESPAQKLRPNMAGYLTKRGKNFGGWKARYFVLDGPNFKYYEGPGGAHLGSIKLPNAQIGKQSVSQSQAHDDEDNQFRHAFLILEPKKKDSSSLVRHVLCAESDDERDQWVDALLHYVDYKDEDEVQAGRQAQVTKSEISAPRSPRLQKSMNDLRTGPSNTNLIQAVGYNETVAGDTPVMGPAANLRTTETPSPPHDKLTSGADTAPTHPIISGPSNLQVIQNTGDWGMKVPPTPGKDRKRSVFQLPFGKGRSSSDIDPHDAKSPGVKNADKSYSRAVFGVPLAEAVEFARPADADTELPAVVYRCIQYLTAMNAVAEEGIFRLSGSNTVIRALKERFNNEGDVDLLEDETRYDIHAVASLLKLYLRELPASILTRDLHLDFLHCLEMHNDEKIPALRALVNRLPVANRALLEALSGFMLLIVNNVGVNKMNVRNRKSMTQ